MAATSTSFSSWAMHSQLSITFHIEIKTSFLIKALQNSWRLSLKKTNVIVFSSSPMAAKTLKKYMGGWPLPLCSCWMLEQPVLVGLLLLLHVALCFNTECIKMNGLAPKLLLSYVAHGLMSAPPLRHYCISKISKWPPAGGPWRAGNCWTFLTCCCPKILSACCCFLLDQL